MAADTEAVFPRLCDFDRFEGMIRNAGGTVERTDPAGAPAAGSRWAGDVTFGGRVWRFEGTVDRMEPPRGYVTRGLSSGVQIVIKVTCATLASGRSRVTVSVELSPKTLAARVLLKPISMGQASIEERFDRRVGAFLREVEQDIGAV
ncbi:SRPBCC family protein [Actibacterium sp. 188UL27-1]|uniref:SRPBCC family protein n=1 Tax=Actibacterium sp. 188UL27-1 TaxID=2786961 RepID=UPI00195875C6|nr:SRPBCC family protein [Actibacterium sp. 188UL27-1]